MTGGVDGIFSLVRNPSDAGLDKPHDPGKQEKPDWSASLSLIHEAAEAMRATAERAQKIEARAQELLRRARQEMENTHVQINALEARLRAAEIREKQAEARAREAEEWLRRIHEAIIGQLPAGMDRLKKSVGSGPTDPTQGTVAAE